MPLKLFFFPDDTVSNLLGLQSELKDVESLITDYATYVTAIETEMTKTVSIYYT